MLAIKLLPSVVTDEGIVSEVKPEHPEKALELIVDNELGRDILVNPVHPANALELIFVNEFGNDMPVKPEQL